MTRLLILLAIAFAIVWWFRRPPRPTPTAKTSSTEQPLLSCEQCGVLIPENTAFRDPQNRAFCSAEHLSQARRPKP